MKKALIMIPTYLEKENLKTLIPEIFKQQEKTDKWEIHVLIIDSSSPDNTEDLLKKFKKQYKNRFHYLITKKEGLGKALYTGYKYGMKEIKPYIFIQMDADWSHNPNLIPKILKKVEKGYDVVVGARYIKGGSIPSDWGIHRKIFSVVGNWVIRLSFAKLNVHDWTSGYRAIKAWIPKKVIEKLKKYNSYVFQVAMIDNALKLGAKIGEVPLVFKDREKGKSKINSIQYIIHTLIYALLNSPFMKFVIVGTLGFVIDFSVSFLAIEKLKLGEVLGVIIGSETAIISNFTLNNFWSFNHKTLKGGPIFYLYKFIKFNFISLGNILIQAFGVWAALKIFGNFRIEFFNFSVGSWIIYKAVVIIFFIIPLSYYLYNKVIWKDNK